MLVLVFLAWQLFVVDFTTTPYYSYKMLKELETYVWYVAFGSNLSSERFLVYILGGSAKGRQYHQPGSSDHTLPTESRSIEVPYSLYFSGNSLVWDGAVAFLTHTTGANPAKVRAYRIKLGQFWDVIHQENHWQAKPTPIALDVLRAQGSAVVESPDKTNGNATGQYAKVLYLGELDGAPLLSATIPTPHAKALKPSAAYLQMLGRGLRESHQLTPAEIANYIHACAGVSDNYTLAELVELFDALEPKV